MNIYFSGIGGVGLGPLAEIALDAGYTVMGSDPKESLMTEQLSERGVMIDTDQSGAFLREIHEKQPLDWFVYTSALPKDHPELVEAERLGIRTSKRDGLLDFIVKEKNLKLIAVAGTHGKTTTTSLLVWTFMQLGIPVSYSVGTTMSFGPSGVFDPASEYFVYECDEYDRNHLQFHPYLSLIPSLSYDHPDTYTTPEDYIASFRQFLQQSEGSIVWKQERDQLGDIPNTWVLGENDITELTLPGEHIRRNASLVIKALERIGVTDGVIPAMSSFPGVDRRFEKLSTNIYTDYAIHPIEIAATIKMARELNNDIVVVYQPHQNVRQHAVRDQYADCFSEANDICWLPTYLTREDPNLHVLTPQELTAKIAEHEKVHYASLDDDLWQFVQLARDRGALVLFMGAGNIDNWVREKIATKHTASTLLVGKSGDFVMQHRDDKPDISDPGLLSLFGGRVEPEDASLLDGAVRELREETNLKFEKDDLKFLSLTYLVNERGPAFIATYTLKKVSTDNLEIYEGQGFELVSAESAANKPLAPIARSVINEYENGTDQKFNDLNYEQTKNHTV